MAYDPTKPEQNGFLVSADHRQNWVGLQYSEYVNLQPDPCFEIWPAGDSAAPAYYYTGGAGVAIARAGTGLADTNTKEGDFCAKLTAGGGATGELLFKIMKAATFTKFISIRGREISLGAWVKAGNLSSARLEINDGHTSPTFSAFHTGGGGWEWLTVTHTVHASSSTTLFWRLLSAAGNVAYISGPTLVWGPVKPLAFLPSNTLRGIFLSSYEGNAYVLTTKSSFMPQRPFIVTGTQIQAITAPTGAALIADVEHHDGSAWQSMYSTRPQIAAAASPPLGFAAPDGTYRYRCFAGYNATITDRAMRVALDQIGSTIAGADVRILVHTRQWMTPLEQYWAYDEYGNAA